MQDHADKNWVREITALFSEHMFLEVDSPDMNLLEAGILDSMLIVELLANLEQRFGIIIPMAELDIHDFSSVAAIARLLRSWNFVPPSDAEPSTNLRKSSSTEPGMKSRKLA